MTARSGILGLGSRLYPGSLKCILNKDLTRFMQRLYRERQEKGSASRVQLNKIKPKRIYLVTGPKNCKPFMSKPKPITLQLAFDEYHEIASPSDQFVDGYNLGFFLHSAENHAICTTCSVFSSLSTFFPFLLGFILNLALS